MKNKTKICSNKDCEFVGIEQPIKEFSRDMSRKDGYCSICKNCDKQYYENNKEKICEQKRQYYRNNRKKISKRNNGIKGRYRRYKHEAKRKKCCFNLTLEQFAEITNQKCFYCNEYSNIKYHIGVKSINTNINYCGIDRIDNNKEYDFSNCVPCCEMCNRMKLKHSQQDFWKKIEKIYLNRTLNVNK